MRKNDTFSFGGSVVLLFFLGVCVLSFVFLFLEGGSEVIWGFWGSGHPVIVLAIQKYCIDLCDHFVKRFLLS